MQSIKELKNLRGRRSIITGAYGSLGKVITQTLAELGSDLILVDKPDSINRTFEKVITDNWGIDIISIECDLEKEEDRVRLFQNIADKRLQINSLINNAAFVGDSDMKGWSAPFEDQSLKAWRRAIEVNLTAAFHLSQLFAPALRENSGGNILNISSIYGEYAPDWSLYEGTNMGNPAAYSASKGGLIQLTRWLATTLAPEVRVNSIAPGGIHRNQTKQFVEKYEKKTPMKRMASEDDLRGAVAFLSSDMSNYVTGQTIFVDGGWGIW